MMFSPFRRTMVLALASLVMTAGPAAAHRGHDAMTMVTLGDGGRLTVSHRFEAHDLEPALAKIAPDAQTSLDDPEAITALKAYLLRRFTVSAKGKAVGLTITAVDIDASQVRVECAGTVKGAPKTLELQSSILRDVYPSQVNQVIFRHGKFARTLRFAGSEAYQVPTR
jgi:hypothetical protein